MPVPTKMAELFLAAASNSPAGTEAIGNNLDDYIRSTAAIIRSTNSISTAAIASATTTDIASSDGEYVVVNGSTTINSLGTGFAGCVRQVQFAGALSLIHSADIVLPGSVNIVTAVNDMLTFRCVVPGKWILVSGSRPTDPLKANLASPTFTGVVTIPGPGPNSWQAGTGDGATLTTFNTKLLLWQGWGLADNTDTVRGVYNARTGTWNVTGGYQVSGSAVWHAGTFDPALKANAANAALTGTTTATALNLSAGRVLTQIQLGTAAPGALADGVLYLRY